MLSRNKYTTEIELVIFDLRQLHKGRDVELNPIRTTAACDAVNLLHRGGVDVTLKPFLGLYLGVFEQHGGVETHVVL